MNVIGGWKLWTLLAVGTASAALPFFAEAEVGMQNEGIGKGVSQYAPTGTLDKKAYDAKMIELANQKPVDPKAAAQKSLWPAKAPYPNDGAALPFNRIVAYYGNFYSRGMGVLGQYDEATMMKKFDAEKKAWEEADPATSVIRAVDYIAIVAQAGAGKDGKYRLRMPDKEIKKAIALAEKIQGIAILEVQAGLADLQGEIKYLEPYLKLPNVHLAIDPEFRMKGGAKPGTMVGTVSHADVNVAAEYLAALVRDNGLPPKVLVVHRYTTAMVTGATKIAPLPEVQIVMDMDGWGSQGVKLSTYDAAITKEPVQFSGFKLFYKNDKIRPGSRLLTPKELLELVPKPSFIQYQ